MNHEVVEVIAENVDVVMVEAVLKVVEIELVAPTTFNLFDISPTEMTGNTKKKARKVNQKKVGNSNWIYSISKHHKSFRLFRSGFFLCLGSEISLFLKSPFFHRFQKY